MGRETGDKKREVKRVERKDLKDGGKRRKWKIIGVTMGGVVIAGLIVGLIIFMMVRPWPVKLADEYYGESEMMTLTKDEYEKLLAEGKSFVVMVDNAGCTTTERMRGMMAEFPGEMQFKYYQMMWPEAMESSLHEYVKYFPSVVVVKDGKVAYYLRADADEDAIYYNSGDELEKWLRERVEFGS